ncbi:amidase [Paenibacillus albidus]|uniref:Amidase n=1 Tax=Paenibacillus albidus TaxID=2041023 RepID=A0A917FF15_9BACL|nr:amidase family protein [Paenibacillus albidus]GGF69406.1 amidase [Paenibacillus albidus]
MNVAYLAASDVIRLLEQGDVTSRQLLDYYYGRMDLVNEQLNAVVQQQRETAYAQADQADRDRKEGRKHGPLHGLPLTVKESFDVSGMLTTSGAPHLKHNIAAGHAVTVQRLIQAGAIILGKTNVPTMTSDWQTYNDLYGTTNNPWDISLTPGGSSGGSAAALAADCTPVEFGSDLIGCLRIPAHYTGVYAHRCSLGMLSLRGHVPGNPPGDPSEPDLSAAGPLARSARDLRLMMDVLYDPWVDVSVAPDFRKNTLKEQAKIRVLTWFEAPGHQLDERIKRRYADFTEALSGMEGVEVHHGMPPEIRMDDLFELAMKLSGRLVGTSFNSRQRLTASLASLGLRASRLVTKAFPEGLDEYYRAMNQSEGEQAETDRLRQHYNGMISSLLQEYDVLLLPISPVLAIPHMQQAVHRRALDVNGQATGYNEHLIWNIPATVFGLPATILPLNRASDELPCGIQIVSGHFKDHISIDFAEICESLTGGFQIPPGYS